VSRTVEHASPGKHHTTVDTNGGLANSELAIKPWDRLVPRGRGGQFILCIPKLKLIAVFTSRVDNPLLFQPLDMLQKFIIPAAIPK
jgi:hypothetical protein